jgi:hypothetical protein
MAPENLAPFLPRRNKDGSFSSICTICFVTIGGVWDKIELRNLELSHVCVESPLTLRFRKRHPSDPPRLDHEPNTSNEHVRRATHT